MSASEFFHDGTVFDLTRTFADCTGVVWHWTGLHTDLGEPLMQSTRRDRETGVHRGAYDQGAVPLPDVYRDRGPLIPIPAAAAVSAAGFEGIAA
jgi:hypothetical protein